MKPAFSTVACPDWTFPRIAEHACAWGFLGCELRTFGYGSREFACEPALTAPAKLRGMLERAGLSICSLATSIRYDEPVTPPLLGFLLDQERMIRETKACVDMAVQLEAPFVRVFAFEVIGSEARKKAIARIADRLAKCADYCRNSGVRLMLENGGSFPRAADIAEIIDKVDHPLLCASYSTAVAQAAGEPVENGINVLGERAVSVKLKDMRGSTPCALGDGDLGPLDAVAALRRAGFDGWVIHEFDRAWIAGEYPNLDEVMAKSAQRLFGALAPSARVPMRA